MNGFTEKRGAPSPKPVFLGGWVAALDECNRIRGLRPLWCLDFESYFINSSILDPCLFCWRIKVGALCFQAELGLKK